MQLFYHNDVLNDLLLPVDEARHCLKVLRYKKGDNIQIINGKGDLITARILNDKPEKCSLEIVEVKQPTSKVTLYRHIAIAPTKNIDRIEWMLEKAVETGIDEVTFIRCAHSERKHMNYDRLERIVLSAMKQSLKYYHTIINPLVDFETFVSTTSHKNRFIASLQEGSQPLSHFKDVTDTLVLIGPEGDFSPEEINLAKEKGFVNISLGVERLRTETAGLTACILLNHLFR